MRKEGRLELGRHNRRPIPLLGWGHKVWKREVEEHVNDELLKDLHEAVSPPQDAEGNKLPQPRRKDMVGISGGLGRYATTAGRNLDSWTSASRRTRWVKSP